MDEWTGVDQSLKYEASVEKWVSACRAKASAKKMGEIL